MTFWATVKQGNTWKIGWENTTPFSQSGNMRFLERTFQIEIPLLGTIAIVFSTRRQKENYDLCSTENIDQLSSQTSNPLCSISFKRVLKFRLPLLRKSTVKHGCPDSIGYVAKRDASYGTKHSSPLLQQKRMPQNRGFLCILFLN